MIEEEDEYIYDSQASSVCATPLVRVEYREEGDELSRFLLSGSAVHPVTDISKGTKYLDTLALLKHLDEQVTDTLRRLSETLGLNPPPTPERALQLLVNAGTVGKVVEWVSNEATYDPRGGGGSIFDLKRSLLKITDDLKPASPPSSRFFCQVTYEEFRSPKAAGAFALSCGHYFSKQGWEDYLTAKLEELPSISPLQCVCPAYPHCPMLVPLSLWRPLLDRNPDKRTKFLEGILRGWLLKIPGNPHSCLGLNCPFWCFPANGEGVIIPTDSLCPRGHCHACGENQLHKPATCEEMRKWKTPANDAIAMDLWKNEMVKDDDGKLVRQAVDCPKCGDTVSKRGGCVHFTHTSKHCGHHFCWSCLKKWPCKNSYSCTDAPENTVPEHLQNASKDSIKLFRWAYDRYISMEEGEAQAKQLRRKIIVEEEERGVAMGGLAAASQSSHAGGAYGGASRMLMSPLQFMQDSLEPSLAGDVKSITEKALDVLLAGFCSAKWTYVVAYSRTPDPNFRRPLFEDAQGLLEKELGKLKGCLTELSKINQVAPPTDPSVVQELRLRLINHIGFTDSFKSKLLEVRGERLGGGIPCERVRCTNQKEKMYNSRHNTYQHNHTGYCRGCLRYETIVYKKKWRGLARWLGGLGGGSPMGVHSRSTLCGPSTVV